MTELDLVKKRQQVEKMTNELRLMELETALENFKKSLVDVDVRQKTDLDAAVKAQAIADKAYADKLAAHAAVK